MSQSRRLARRVPGNRSRRQFVIGQQRLKGPNIAQRQASTTVTVKDGQSFVLGGLLEKNELNSLSKIPILGDLPLIGGLFRVRHDTSSTDNLYIVVTPHVVHRVMPATATAAAAPPPDAAPPADPPEPDKP